MNASPYTWEQWQIRFHRTLNGLKFTGTVDITRFEWDWENGDDPETVAEAFVNEQRDAQ